MTAAREEKVVERYVGRVKKKPDSIYLKLGIKEKAKATDLKDLYNYKDTPKRDNGKTIACLCILSAKIKNAH